MVTAVVNSNATLAPIVAKCISVRLWLATAWEHQCMKTLYTVAIATFAGVAIGAAAIQALHAQARPRAFVVIEMDVVNQDAFFKEFVRKQSWIKGVNFLSVAASL